MWTTADGLPQNSITDIVETRDGYLWLTTFGGLARFDGLRFTVFDAAATEGIDSNRLTALYEDSSGTLWIGTEDGRLLRFQNGRFTTFRTNDTLAGGKPVWDLEADEDGGLWMATTNGLFRYRNGIIHRDLSLGIPGATAFTRGAAGDLWIATPGGIARLDRKDGIETFPLRLKNPIYALLEDRSGRILLSYRNNLVELRNGELRPRFELPTRPHLMGAVLEDRDGCLWFTGRGVDRWNPVSEPPHESILDGVKIRQMYEDREGNLWIGTDGDGLHRLRDGAFSSYSDSKLTPATSIAEGEGGRILVGTICRGVFEIAGGTLSRLPLPREHFECITSVLVDRSGQIWVGGFHLAQSKNDGWKIYTPNEGVPTTLQAIYEDCHGRMWAGTQSGAVRREGDRWIRFGIAEGLLSEDIRFIAEDRYGDLWLGSPEGLTRFLDGQISPRKVRHYTEESGLPTGTVRDFYADPQGGLWFGTYGGGLVSFERVREKFVILDTGVGMVDNVVSRILEDDFGHLWLSGNRGISRLARAEAEAFVRGEVERVFPRLYSEADGMMASETNGGSQPAGWKAKNGRLWFPTIQGAVAVDPERLRAPTPPAVVIEKVRVDGREIDLRQSAVIPPGARDLEVEYTALQLGLPEEAVFRYRLKGFDQGWSDVGGRRTSYHTQVSPGTYRFEVTAAAYRGGEWNPEVASVPIIFEPFFWQRPAFHLGGTLTLIALAVFVFRWRTRRVERHNAELLGLNAELHQAIAELETKNAEMERFTYTVSHDLKSPLVTILGFLGIVEKDLDGGDRERLRQDLARIRTAGQTMAQLLDELLELSRIGRLTHTPQKIDLTELAHEAAELCAGILQERQIDLAISSDLPQVLGDRPRLLEVFQNLLENAARFMGDQERPRIRIRRRSSGDHDTVVVRDNGIGIEASYHEKIFGLFERLDTDTEGTGVGLALVKRIIEFHGGHVWVESEGLGQGSAFCFTLPNPSPGGTPSPSDESSVTKR